MEYFIVLDMSNIEYERKDKDIHKKTPNISCMCLELNLLS